MPGAAGWARLRAALGVYKLIKKQRATRRASTRHQLQASLLAGQQEAIAAVIPLVCEEGAGRRTVLRALGRWRGSTVSGYLRGDDKTYLDNFRCTKHRFNDMVIRLSGSSMDTAENRASQPPARFSVMAKANQVRDDPPLRYKLAACLYTLGQGGPVKTCADALSLGPSTLKKYLNQFAGAVVACMGPIFMPCKPMSAQDIEAIQGQFASRRGMRPVTLACDGSHIPFKPKSKKVADEYRNYKGWHSIL